MSTFKHCIDCNQGMYPTNRTGPAPDRCPKCARAHKRLLTRDRVRRHRRRKARAEKTDANSQSPEAARPVAGCGREGTERHFISSIAKSTGGVARLFANYADRESCGLYADLPEPDRTARRQEVGLR